MFRGDELDKEEDLIAGVTCVLASHFLWSVWVYPINQLRRVHDEFHQLMPQLLEDENHFLMYYRMLKDQFFFILNLISSELEKYNTQMRD
ncbi:hypothetical protein PR048_009028 [Dryococelus australis]|uniref:Uncharacterized protein n=1 Tax=Dryococelus australis TaxID=614101 RepID=A0ABQ9HYS5_9NEOP|nr:hypothetical protein PR048_009028 [Dryococelus australis]